MFDSFFGSIGRYIIKRLDIFIEVLKLYKYSFRAIRKVFLLKSRYFIHQFLDEVFFTGIMAIPMIFLLGFFIGFIGVAILPINRIAFGVDDAYGFLYAKVIVLTLAPLITGIIVAIRTTISLIFRIAPMKLSGEIKALEIMGINPVDYLGTARFIAGVFTLPVLTLYFSLSIVVAGMLTVSIFDLIDPYNFFKQIINFFTFKDLLFFSIRPVIIAHVIYFVAIYNGIAVESGNQMVINRTIKAITFSLLLLIMLNIVFVIGGNFYGK